MEGRRESRREEGLRFSRRMYLPRSVGLARRAENPYRAELRNLTIDSALGGVWIAAMQFNLLPSVVIFAMLCMDKLSVGGMRLLARGLGAQALAAAMAIALFGPGFEPETSMLEIL